MKTLPVIAPSRTILSFDFDGTLHDPASSPPVPIRFFEIIHRLRAEQHALWGINTGRSIEHMIEGFHESHFAYLPDWVVAREREIYFPTPDGQWQSHESWNTRCAAEIGGLFERLGHLLDWVKREVEAHTGAQWLELAGEPAGVISRTEEEMEWIVNHMTPVLASEPELSWQRNTIYLRFGHRDFHKGSCLSEVTRLHQLDATRCFAMGDSYNDMEMLDNSHAEILACPANALDLVKAKVLAHRGLVTRGMHGDGVIEALQKYFL